MDKLLIACRDTLRTGFLVAPDLLGTTNTPATVASIAASIKIMPEANPPAYSGQTFISLYGSSWEPAEDGIDSNRGLHETFGITVCVNRKTRTSPYDRAGEEAYIQDAQSMGKVCYRVMRLLDKNITPMIAANTGLAAKNYQIEFLRWLGTDPNPIPQPPEWFGLEDANASLAGYIMQVRFGRARRSQTYQDMTEFDP